MQLKLTELSRLYLAALIQYLSAGPGPSLESAHKLGRHAMTLGLETLDLARIHEIALVTLVLPSEAPKTRESLMGRAGMFFAEVLTPIEETHRGAREANIHLNYMITALSQRTHELAASVDELKQEIEQRTAVEESLRVSQQTSSALLKHSRLLQDELRQLSRQLLSVQEEERKRISRELHDVIAQTLTGINVRLAALKTESTVDIKDLQKKITSTQRLVEKSVDIVHRFARELRPSVLDDLGLIPALESFMKEFMEKTGVRVSLKAFADIEMLDSIKRTVLYRIAQEALTNVARHAHANHVAVCFQDQSGVIRMEITDDGQGFAVDGTSKAKTKNNRLGLLGMRERVEMVGGTFCVESAPGKGTTVRIEVPVASSGAKKPLIEKSCPPSALECP